MLERRGRGRPGIDRVSSGIERLDKTKSNGEFLGSMSAG
jgi:hypothetical protein